MISVDRKTSVREEKPIKKRLHEEARVRRMKFEGPTSWQKSDLKGYSTSSSSDSDNGSKEMLIDTMAHHYAETSVKKKARPIQNIASSDLCAALDRSKLTDRMATYIVSATAKALGHDTAGFNISRSSIKRKREINRKNLNIDAIEQVPSVVHWDGKLMEDLVPSEKRVERIAITISNINGQSRILGIPKTNSGKGEEQASAVCHHLSESELTNYVIGLCFDTTASNTGIHSGACANIQRQLNKNLFHFTSRHHIMEIMVGGVFSSCYESTSAPDAPYLIRLNQNGILSTRLNIVHILTIKRCDRLSIKIQGTRLFILHKWL